MTTTVTPLTGLSARILWTVRHLGQGALAELLPPARYPGSVEDAAKEVRMRDAALLPHQAEAVGRTNRTWWNGQPAPAYKVVVRVGRPPTPTWWCADLEGQERRAVLVLYGDRRYLLDDQAHDDDGPGRGWAKVTVGKGGPSWPSRSLPDSSEIIAGYHR